MDVKFAFNNTFGAASSSPSLFGAAPQAASTPSFSFPSLFGGASAGPVVGASSAATGFGVASSPSLFGGAALSTPSFGAFGASKPLAGFGAAQPAVSSLPGFPPFPTSSGNVATSQVAADLHAIQAAFEPKPDSNAYRFRHLFVNVATSDQGVSLAAKPQNIDAVQWQEALDEVESLEASTSNHRPANERLWPVGLGYGNASGFDELIARGNAQEAEIVRHREFLDRIKATLASIARKHDVDVKKAVHACRMKHEEQQHKLIHIMRFVELLEHRAFRHPYTSAEDDLAREFDRLRNTLHGDGEGMGMGVSSAQSAPAWTSDARVADPGLRALHKRIEALGAYAREQKARKQNGKHAGGPESHYAAQAGLSAENAEKICRTLSEYLEAINRIQKDMQRAQLHLEILEDKNRQ